MSPALRRAAAFAAVVTAALFGQWLIAEKAADDAAQLAYENQLAGCERGNVTIRGPLQEFFSAFANDEALETDDEELLVAIREARDSFDPVSCSQVVERP